MLFVTDGFTGIKDAISNVFPKAGHQPCWVHLARNVSHAVRVKDRSEVLNDLKTVYTQESVEAAEEKLDTFIQTWHKKYPKVTDKFEDNSSLFTFLSFPKQIRGSIYTTNLIEGFNKHLKRYTKRKEQFPNEDSLIRFIGTYAGVVDSQIYNITIRVQFKTINDKHVGLERSIRHDIMVFLRKKRDEQKA